MRLTKRHSFSLAVLLGLASYALLHQSKIESNDDSFSVSPVVPETTRVLRQHRQDVSVTAHSSQVGAQSTRPAAGVSLVRSEKSEDDRIGVASDVMGKALQSEGKLSQADLLEVASIHQRSRRMIAALRQQAVGKSPEEQEALVMNHYRSMSREQKAVAQVIERAAGAGAADSYDKNLLNSAEGEAHLQRLHQLNPTQ